MVIELAESWQVSTLGMFTAKEDSAGSVQFKPNQTKPLQ